MPIIIELSPRCTDMVIDLARRHRCEPADVAGMLLELGIATLQGTSDALARLPVPPDPGKTTAGRRRAEIPGSR